MIYKENDKIHSPIITYDKELQKCTILHSNSLGFNEQDTDYFIAFHEDLSFNPYTLYLNGEMSIMYLLNQDAIESRHPIIKCDIIDAKNALTLHESDVHYFYKPSIITQQKDGEYDYFKMVFKMPDNYTIPDNLLFKFKEYCFGNEWVLEWTKDEQHPNGYWNGKNCQGKVNKKVINKANLPCQVMTVGILNIRKNYGAWIMIKESDWNKKLLPEHSKGLAHSLWENTKKKFKFLMKDGTIKNCEDYYQATVELSEVPKDTPPNYTGYSNLPIKCIFKDEKSSTVNNMKAIQEAIEKLYVEFYLPNQIQGVRLIFKTNSGSYNTCVNSFGTLMNIVSEYDTIDKLAYEWEATIENNTRDVMLYLRKDLTDSLEEINWDSSTNAFDYIIRTQFYEITPNPNAATTLYTDYNITSSKIITADNITTMRSDLNMVTNNVDVIDYDVKELTVRVDTLNAEMGQTKTIMKYMQEDIHTNRIIASTALALSAVNSFTQIGMILSSKGLQFIGQAESATEEAIEGVSNTERTLYHLGDGSNLPDVPVNRSMGTDLTPILDWCNEGLIPIEYTNEAINPKTIVVSLRDAIDLCNHFRETLKPSFKLLATKIEEVETDLNFSNTTIDTKIEEIKNDFVNKSDLVRDDKIDIRCACSTRFVRLTAEDTIDVGTIRIKVFVAGKDPQIISITFNNSQITEYKGIDDETEAFRTNYLNNITLNDKIILIERAGDIQIAGATIESNTCARRMTYTINDLAYIQDIQALDEKITALAEQSHTNDVEMFATVDEVNDVLLNNYVNKIVLNDYALKTSIPTDYINETTLTTKLDDYVTKTALTDNYYNAAEINEELNNYAYKTEIPTIPDNLVNNESLANTLNNYALKTDYVSNSALATTLNGYTTTSSLMTKLNDYALKTSIPTDYVSSSSLTTKLNSYALKTSIPTDYVSSSSLTTKLNDYALKTSIPTDYIKSCLLYTSPSPRDS